MGLIRDDITISGNEDRVVLNALFDTGADHSVIRHRLSNGMSIDDIGPFEYYPECVSILLPGEYYSNEEKLYDFVVFTSIDILGSTVNMPGFVLMEIGEDLLIGHEIMQKIGISLDLKHHKIMLQK